MERFSERLLWARGVAGLSQRGLAVRAGISNTLVSGFESDDGRPGMGTVEKLAAALGVSPGWLAFGEGPAPTEEQVRAGVAA